MTQQCQIYWAYKFFPHLTPKYGVLAVRACLSARGHAFENFDVEKITGWK